VTDYGKNGKKPKKEAPGGGFHHADENKKRTEKVST
jgi:hypothetical protein